MKREIGGPILEGSGELDKVTCPENCLVSLGDKGRHGAADALVNGR